MNRPALRGRFLSRTMTLAAVFVVASGFFHVPKAHASFSETLTSADVGNSYSVDFSRTITGGTLSALGTFTVEKLTASDLTLGWTVGNATANANSSLNPIVINSIGFEGGSALTGAKITTKGSYFRYAYFPGGVDGFKSSENVCMTGFSKNCSGGHGTLTPGSSDSFVLALSGKFGTSSPSITLSDFAVKFQTSEGSYEFGGNALSETPEPGTLALFGTALLLAVGTFLRRRLLPASQEVLRE